MRRSLSDVCDQIRTMSAQAGGGNLPLQATAT